MLGEINNPQLVWPARGEVSFHQVIVRRGRSFRRSCFTVAATLNQARSKVRSELERSQTHD